MKIAMIGHKRIPSREGGVEIVVEELSTRLVENGHKVDVYNRKGKNVQDKNADKEKKGLKEYKGVKIITIPTINKKGIDALLYSFFATIKALFGKYDVIHYHAEGSCAMIWLPHLFGIKTVATIHGLDWKRSKWGGFATKYIKFGEKIAAKYADEIIVLSKGVQKYFKDTYNRDTNFIPNGVNKPEIKEANLIKEKWGLEKDNYILFLARIVPEKGLHYLIEAYKQIHTDKKLVIAGGASHTNDYLEQIKEKVKDDNRIIMTGFVQGEELKELYSNCYLYCLPSDVEGMPISLLEAMSYGCNCLVSDIEENTQVIEKYAITFEKSNVNDLKNKLEEVINLNSKNKFNKNEIQEYSSKFNWENNLKETEKTYKTNYAKENVFYKLLSIFFLLVPILITLDNYINIVGTVLTAIPLILGIIVLLQQKKKIIKLILISILLLGNIYFVKNYSQHFEFLKPLLIFIIMLDIIENKELLNAMKETFYSHRKFLNISICVIVLINLIMYITDTGISEAYTKIWGLKTFQGTFFDPNQAAYRISTLIVYCILLIKMKINNKYINIILLAVLEFLLLMTGARVPTGLGISLGMIALWYIKDDFLNECKEHKKTIIFLIIVIIILMFWLLPKTAFVKKIITTTESWVGFDNGRSIMWKNSMSYFNTQDIKNKLFGNDIQIIYNLNMDSLGAMVWCHNDLIQILLQFGLIMFFVYIYTFIRTMILHLKEERKINKLIIILLYTVLMFVAVFNGLFYHPRFMISIPILFMIYKVYENKTN